MQEWLTRGIAVYHNKSHSGLDKPPLQAWKNGIVGTEQAPGRGLPPRIVDPERFFIDFLPLERRAVSRKGVQLFRIDYFSDVLRPLINDGQRYVVRYDPRDLSRIWLLSKDNEYYALPYRERHRPPISLWEHKTIVRKLQEEGRRQVDGAAIFTELEKMRAVVVQAAATTKKARRQAERIRQAPKARSDRKNEASETNTLPEENPVKPRKRFIVEEW